MRQARETSFSWADRSAKNLNLAVETKKAEILVKAKRKRGTEPCMKVCVMVKLINFLWINLISICTSSCGVLLTFLEPGTYPNYCEDLFIVNKASFKTNHCLKPSYFSAEDCGGPRCEGFVRVTSACPSSWDHSKLNTCLCPPPLSETQSCGRWSHRERK